MNTAQKRMGYRVKRVRESKKWTQDQLTTKLGLKDRQTISDIENGKRKLAPEELLKLCDLFDKNLEFFVDLFTVEGEAKFSWRVDPEIPEDRLKYFERKANQWVGLFRWLCEQEPQSDVLEYHLRLSAHASYEDAQQCAEDLISQLKLGLLPAALLLEKVERILRIPIFFIHDTNPTDSDFRIPGAACHLDKLNVILINRDDTEARRLFTLAHELFHVLTWNILEPPYRESNITGGSEKRKRIEGLANNFAAALLMPRASLEELIDEDHIHDEGYLCDIAQQLKVSCDALAWRLFNLKKINKNLRDMLLGQQYAGLSTAPKRFSESFVKMLHAALQKGYLSARKAARLMHLSVDELILLFKEYRFAAPFEL